MRLSRGAAPVLLIVMLSGCSGGGGSPASGAKPAAASPTPFVNPDGTTAFAVTTVPEGLTVSYSDGVQTGSAITPTLVEPANTNVAVAVTIVPSNGNVVYDFIGMQRNDGTRSVLYNQNADTSGKIAAIATSSAFASRRSSTHSRVTAASASSREPRRRNAGSRGRPRQSATRLVVRYRASSLDRKTHRPLGRQIGAPRGGIATYAVDAPAGTSAAAYAARLHADPSVVSAIPDTLYYLQTTTPVTPNDTHFDDYQQWSMFTTGAVNAWGYTEGTPAVQVAIIDTGVDFSHQDLAGAKIAYAESDIDGVTTVGAASAQDTEGHGTNVAGIAAADTNNAFGFAGMGFNVGLQIYKVFADETAANGYAASANATDVSLAIDDAVAHGARVINLSLGGCAADGYDTSQQDAIDNALAHGVVVVAAAGNERSGMSADPDCVGSTSTVDFPGAFDGVISVGASALDDSANPGVLAGAKEVVASYSNAGPGLSLVAPGGDPPAGEVSGAVTPDLLHWIDGLYSTTAANPAERCKNPADCHALFAGTSQATPHVAGAAALLLSIDAGLSVDQVRTLLLANTDDIGDPLQGSGRLNVYRALAALTRDALAPAPPTARNFVAFAYAPNGTSSPKILDVTYPRGVAVGSDGTYRVADVPANAGNYKIGVWYDANGDGIVDAGDYFASSDTCSPKARCASAASLIPSLVAASVVLN